MFLESEIDLKKSYKAKDLFNLLRARTFAGKPSCWFSNKKTNMKSELRLIKLKININSPLYCFFDNSTNF